MKKILGSAIALSATLAAAVPAYAQNMNPCPAGTFSTLCNITSANFGPTVGKVVTVLLIIVAIISLFFLIIGGLRWVTSGGDKAKVEGARGTIIAAIIGLVIAFLAYFIFSVVLGFFGLSPTNLTLPKF